MADNNDIKESEIRIGFVDLAVFQDGSIRGGILITDIETVV